MTEAETKTKPKQAEQTARQVYVIGHPISHSRSPLIHSFWLNRYADQIASSGTQTGTYEKKQVTPQDLLQFVRQLKEEANWAGANVTIPHKEHIKQLCDELTDTAQAIGAVNTIFKRDGKLIGDNTDAYGFIANLDELAPNWKNSTKNITILGAGGATRGLLFGLLQATQATITLVNRTQTRAQALANDFGSSVHTATSDNLSKILPTTDLLINATSIGMKNDENPALDLSLLPKSAIVCDIVYTPLQTPLLKEAHDLGLTCVDGLGMLLHQAVPGFQYWFGVRPEVDAQLRQLIVDDLVAHGQA